jgi:hypothetical protein
MTLLFKRYSPQATVRSFLQACIFFLVIFSINAAGDGLRACGHEIALVDGEWICIAAVLQGGWGEKVLASHAVGGRHLVHTRRDVHKLMNIL